MSPRAMRVLAGVLEEHSGQQLAAARQWRVETALAPLMRDRGIDSLDQLAGLVGPGRDGRLTGAVVEALLNNETFFFRDRPAFDLLTGPALDRLRAARPGRALRIWCAGCSTGQEVYSLAISLAEQRERWTGWRIELFGTDVSRAAIEQARQGLYSQFEIQRGLPVKQMLDWFTTEGDQWRARPELREAATFHVQNLLDASLPGRFDIILCRNLLLYFTGDRRRAVLARLAGAIAPDGVLMLGAGETVIGQTDDFVSDPECRGLYRLAAA